MTPISPPPSCFFFPIATQQLLAHPFLHPEKAVVPHAAPVRPKVAVNVGMTKDHLRDMLSAMVLASGGDGQVDVGPLADLVFHKVSASEAEHCSCCCSAFSFRLEPPASQHSQPIQRLFSFRSGSSRTLLGSSDPLSVGLRRRLANISSRPLFRLITRPTVLRRSPPSRRDSSRTIKVNKTINMSFGQI